MNVITFVLSLWSLSVAPMMRGEVLGAMVSIRLAWENALTPSMKSTTSFVVALKVATI